MSTKHVKPTETLEYELWFLAVQNDANISTHSLSSDILVAFKSSMPHTQTLMSRWFYKYLQFTGTLPCSVPGDFHLRHRSLARSHLYMAISMLVGLLTTIYSICLCIVLAHDNKSQIAKWEFFSLIDIVFKVHSIAQTPLICTIVLWKRGKMAALITHMDEHLSHLLSHTQFGQRRRCSLLALSFTLTCVAGAVTSVFMYSVILLSYYPEYTWTSRTTFLVYEPQGFELTLYNLALLISLASALAVSADISAQMFTVLMVSAVDQGLRQVKRNLGACVFKPDAEAVRKIKCAYLKLQFLMNEFNGACSYLLLVSSMRDLLIIVAITAAFLRVPITHEDGETEAAFKTRVMDEAAVRAELYAYTLIGVSASIVRTLTSFSLQNQTREIKNLAQKIKAATTKDAVHGECILLQAEIDGNMMAASGGGFFFLTRDYFTALVGVVLTYFFLIYQTRDSKTDIKELVSDMKFTQRVDDIERVLRQLVVLIVNGSSNVNLSS